MSHMQEAFDSTKKGRPRILALERARTMATYMEKIEEYRAKAKTELKRIEEKSKREL